MRTYNVWGDRQIHFVNKNICLMDIDHVFRQSNTLFAQLLSDIGLPKNYDFSQKINKQLYTHAFLLTLCEVIKKHTSTLKLKFYSNTFTKDLFRNKLLNRLQSIFGFKVINGGYTFPDLVDCLNRQEGGIISNLEIFFAEESKPKSFKHIKKYLQKNGLTELEDTYFQDIANKLMILI